ncbi:MAG TPA: ABC transporter permease [Bacteroidota bacterium]|nr:ABC transporter permease [Bacteroidota bacterium]
MSFRSFIAKRHLISKKGAGFITVISVISIAGITIGVAALIVVLSVFNGFNGLVTSILIGFDPHIRIQRTERTAQQDLDRVSRMLRADPQVAGIGAFVSGKAMIVSRSQSKVVFIRGLEPGSIDKITGVENDIVLGKINFRDTAARDMMIGMTLADRLGVVSGDSVMMISPAGSQRALLGFGTPIVRSYRVAAIYESNNKDYDALYGYMALSSAQELFQEGNAIQGYEVRLKDINDSDGMKKKIGEAFPSAFQVMTWYDLHKDLYSVMKIERWMAYVILCLIIGVATFNLLGSLTMSVIEKTRDIGILKTMGATNRDIISIFRYEGLLVGIIGTTAGSILGLLICYAQIQFHLFALDPTVYIIPAIPVEIRPADFVSVAAAALALSYGATLYPARRAAALLPAEAIRWE